MRGLRFALFAGWMTFSLLAVAGFAAFSAPRQPTDNIGTPPVSVPDDRGAGVGALAALAFSYVAEPVPATATLPTLAQEPLMSPARAIPTTNSTGETAPTTTAGAAGTGLPTSSTTTITSAAPPTSVTSTTTGGSLTERELVALVGIYFRPEDVDRAVGVAYCESRWDPDATNPYSGAAGLFQHLPRYWEERSTAAGWGGAGIYDPHANTAVAAWLLYEGGGWSHWTCA